MYGSKSLQEKQHKNSEFEIRNSKLCSAVSYDITRICGNNVGDVLPVPNRDSDFRQIYNQRKYKKTDLFKRISLEFFKIGLFCLLLNALRRRDGETRPLQYFTINTFVITGGYGIRPYDLQHIFGTAKHNSEFRIPNSALILKVFLKKLLHSCCGLFFVRTAYRYGHGITVLDPKSHKHHKL